MYHLNRNNISMNNFSSSFVRFVCLCISVLAVLEIAECQSEKFFCIGHRFCWRCLDQGGCPEGAPIYNDVGACKTACGHDIVEPVMCVEPFTLKEFVNGDVWYRYGQVHKCVVKPDATFIIDSTPFNAPSIDEPSETVKPTDTQTNAPEQTTGAGSSSDKPEVSTESVTTPSAGIDETTASAGNVSATSGGEETTVISSASEGVEQTTTGSEINTDSSETTGPSGTQEATTSAGEVSIGDKIVEPPVTEGITEKVESVSSTIASETTAFGSETTSGAALVTGTGGEVESGSGTTAGSGGDTTASSNSETSAGASPSGPFGEESTNAPFETTSGVAGSTAGSAESTTVEGATAEKGDTTASGGEATTALNIDEPSGTKQPEDTVSPVDASTGISGGSESTISGQETTAAAGSETTAAAGSETTAAAGSETTAAAGSETTAAAGSETTAAAGSETTAAAGSETTAAVESETTAAFGSETSAGASTPIVDESTTEPNFSTAELTSTISSGDSSSGSASEPTGDEASTAISESPSEVTGDAAIDATPITKNVPDANADLSTTEAAAGSEKTDAVTPIDVEALGGETTTAGEETTTAFSATEDALGEVDTKTEGGDGKKAESCYICNDEKNRCEKAKDTICNPPQDSAIRVFQQKWKCNKECSAIGKKLKEVNEKINSLLKSLSTS